MAYYLCQIKRQPTLKGADVLALACGGGQQCPVFDANGAKVTVTDISNSHLAKEKYVSQREEYDIHIIRTDMSKHFPLADNSFDMIFNPISN